MPPPHNPGGSLPLEYGSWPLKKALQALSIPQNVVWNPFTFRAKEIDESVDRDGDTLMNQRIRLRQFDVAFCYRPKCLKLLDGIFPLI
jgi:hypothetical protein